MTDALTMETRRSERGIAGLLIVQAVAYVLLISLSVFVGLGIVPIEAVVVAALAVVVVFFWCVGHCVEPWLTALSVLSLQCCQWQWRLQSLAKSRCIR